MDYLEKYAAFWCNYVRFVDHIEVHTLMPDKKVMKELKELKLATIQFENWIKEKEADKNEMADQQMSDVQKDQMSAEQKEEYDLNKNESLKKLESEMDTQKE